MVNKHKEKTHNIIKSFKCDKCPSKFEKIYSLKTHLKIHQNERSIKCPFPGCTSIFLEKGNMKSHFKTHVSIFIIVILAKFLGVFTFNYRTSENKTSTNKNLQKKKPTGISKKEKN